MPRIVDPVARRTELADAVWRVIQRDGLDQASVRQVASEAGLSVGSLRHYFSSQSELLVFALDLVGEQLSERISGIDQSGEPRRVVVAMIEEMLPLDTDRRAECEVWVAFAARSLVDDALATVQGDINHRLAVAFRFMIDYLADAGLLREDLDRAVEAERLYSLVDGLILHGILGHDRLSIDFMRKVVERHVEEMTSMP